MTSDERAVLRAFCQKRVSEYAGDEIKMIDAVLLSISLDLGVKQSVDVNQLNRISDFILEYYPKLTVQSIQVAFDLATSKKLDVNTEHYQSFNKKYVGDILSAYVKHMNAIVKKASDEADRIEREQERITASQRQKTPEFQEEMYQGLLKYVQEKHELPDAWNFNACYHHMRRSGLISESVNELRGFMESVKKRVKVELNNAKIEQNKVEEARCMRILNSKDGLAAHWRAEYVKEHFKTIIE